MFDIDYFLFGIVVCSLVAVYGIWSFNRREIAIRRLEEDRKDARQDIAKEQMKQLKQMQYQHELDLQKLEMQISNGDSQVTELMKIVLPMILNKKSSVSETVSDSAETAEGIAQVSNSAGSDVSEAVSSTENEEQKEVRELAENAEPVTDFRRFVDSAAGDVFFHRYRDFLNK